VVAALLLGTALGPADLCARETFPAVLVAEVPDATARAAEAPDAFKEADKETRSHFAAGSFTEALASAERAYALWPVAYAAIVRGKILEKLDRPCAAFEAYLLAVALEPTPDEKARVHRALERTGIDCPATLGWARLASDIPGTVVEIAGHKIMAPAVIGLRAGTHGATAQFPGLPDRKLVLTVAVGRETRARLDQKPSPPARKEDVGERLVPPTTGSTEGSDSTLGWVLLGSGVALAGGGVGMTVWANSARSDAEGYAAEAAKLLNEGRGNTPEYDSLQAKFEDADSTRSTARVASWVLYAAGGGAVVTGVVLLLLNEDGESVSGWAVGPFAVPGGGTIQLSGRF